MARLSLVNWLNAVVHSPHDRARDIREARRAPRRNCVPRLESLESRDVPSTFSVLNLADSGPGSLRQAIVDANALSGADTIQFADGLHGVISLTSGQLSITDGLTITGSGAQKLAVSGQGASRVFDIETDAAASVSIASLTITQGRADKNQPHGSIGGGIYHDGGSLTLTGVVVSKNRALGDASSSVLYGALLPIFGAGAGGGILNNTGLLTITDSLFTENQARGGDHSSDFFIPGLGAGGGVENASIEGVIVTNTRFSDNLAKGGDYCTGSFLPGNADCGAVDTGGGGGPLIVNHCSFDFNQSIGGDYCTGDDFPGSGAGGAIVIEGAVGIIQNSTFDHNLARGGSHCVGGNPGFGGGGGIALTNFGALTVSGCSFDRNAAFGGDDSFDLGNATFFPSFSSGSAGGGGVLGAGGSLDISACSFDSNLAQGGNNNRATTPISLIGAGVGGGLAYEFTAGSVSETNFEHNVARGGDGESGGAGVGGGFANVLGSAIAVNNAILSHNQAQGGNGSATPGAAVGGGIANGFLADNVFPGSGSLATLVQVTVTDNLALGGSGASSGGGLFNGVGDTLDVSHGRVKKNHANGHPGSGGGVYNLGAFTFDVTTVIDDNHASTSFDDLYS